MEPGVVIISPGGAMGGGGMGKVTRLMAGGLSKPGSGRRCVVIDSRGEGSAALSPAYTAAGLIKIAALRARGYRLLHLQVSERLSFWRKSAFLAAGKLLGMGVVLHHHGAEMITATRKAGALNRAVVRFACRRADINIVLGKPWRDFLVDEAGVPAEKVATLYNAVPDQGRPPRPRNATPHFLVSANLSPRKGIGEILAALKTIPDAEVTFAGGGMVERYRAEAEALGISARCHFAGWVNDAEVQALLAKADALLLPSHDEGLPMAVLESLAAGVPVITTPVGAMPEVLRDGETCLFVTPGDAASLAAAIGRIIAGKDLAAGLSQRGRALFEREFALAGYIERLSAIYARVLA